MKKLVAALLFSALFLLPCLAQVVRGRISTPTLQFVAASPYDAAAQTLFSAMSTPPSTARKLTINNVIVAMKACGLWDKLDVLYVFAAADTQAALLNWKNPGTYTASVATGTPTFTTDRGYTGTGSAAIGTGYAPSTLSVGMSTNSMHASAIALTNGASTGAVDIRADSSRLTMRARIGSASAASTAAGTVTNGTAISANPALTTGNRLSSTTQTVYRAGVLDATGSVTSVGLPAQIFILGNPTGGLYTDRQIGWVDVGQGLTDADETCHETAAKAYFADLGVTLQ